MSFIAEIGIVIERRVVNGSTRASLARFGHSFHLITFRSPRAIQNRDD